MAYRKIELTESQMSDMVLRYNAGASLREIAEMYDMSVSAARRKLMQKEVVLRPKGRPLGATHVLKLSLADREQIVVEYQAGASSTELSERYDVSKERICQVCRAAGVLVDRRRVSLS